MAQSNPKTLSGLSVYHSVKLLLELLAGPAESKQRWKEPSQLSLALWTDPCLLQQDLGPEFLATQWLKSEVVFDILHKLNPNSSNSQAMV